MSKPTKIEKVKGCFDCPFNYSNTWGNKCTLGGDPESRWDLDTGDRKPYPLDCPLLSHNIRVELES